MNLNQLAQEMTKLESGKRQVNVAQMKEVIKKLGRLLGTLPGDEAMELVNKIIKAGK